MSLNNENILDDGSPNKSISKKWIIGTFLIGMLLVGFLFYFFMPVGIPDTTPRRIPAEPVLSTDAPIVRDSL